MTNIPIDYIRESWGGAEFQPPPAREEIRDDPFSKASSYGLIIKLPFHLQIKSPGINITMDGIPTKVGLDKNTELFIVYLGLRLKLPTNMAFINQVLLRDAEASDYIIDRNIKADGWYKVNLYFRHPLLKAEEWQPGTPALRIIPISDIHYNFVYRRRLSHEG